VFSILDWAVKNDMIAKDAVWEIACGEITIHTYKDRIYSYVKNKNAYFFTNCFIYDEKIAANLATNPQSAIKLSIDSGTPETWYKIKGMDNFNTVMDNLTKYSASSTRTDQINLKYIILPGINDNLKEYQAVIGIMKSLKVTHLEIACDLHTKYSSSKEQREALIKAAGYLVAILYKNGMTMYMHTDSFFHDETQRVPALAMKLMYASIEFKHITHIPLRQDVSTYDLGSIDLINDNLVLNCGVLDPQVSLSLQEPIAMPSGDPVIEIECTNSESGTIQVFYNFGNGLSEENSFRFSIEKMSEMTKIRLPIVGWQPGINLCSIRIDPPNGTRFEIKNIAILESKS